MAASLRPDTDSIAAQFLKSHATLLEGAQKAILSRGHWAAYPEMPSGKIYGETAKADAEAAFAALQNKAFPLDQSNERQVGKETSPYGFDLGITYPRLNVAALVAASTKAGAIWAKTSINERTGVALEILHRLNKQSFLIANTVMHTSGQAFMMAFQAGGPHAQDRGLEAVAYAYAEMSRIPPHVIWEKPTGKDTVSVLHKEFRIVPRGVALVIGCATFPTWNSYPALFASLVTGNSVIVKPHPGAILPLALTVKIARDVLKEAGFDPNTVLLAADAADAPITKELAQHEAVKIVDFTGSPQFGKWLRENLKDKQVYTEEAGVNSIVIDGTDNFKGMTSNIAFSLALYTGQMCTAPQNIFISKDGIDTPDGKKSFDEVAGAIGAALDKLLSDPERAGAILGAVQNEATLQRIEQGQNRGKTLREGGKTGLFGHDDARGFSPKLVVLDEADSTIYNQECFGPVAFLIKTENAQKAISIAAQAAKEQGAITASLYSTNEAIIAQASDAFAASGTALSINLTGQVYVNQSAAFSDYHVSGANPAGNASLTDSAFVANRFRVVTIRRQA